MKDTTLEQASDSDAKFIVLRRDCVGQMVPAGTKLILQRGTEVKLTQALGDAYTVLVFGNLVRIAGSDADALGFVQDDVLKDIDPSLPLEQKVWQALKTVFDPEIPVSIVELGLIYDCRVVENGEDYDVDIQMTLTSPTCAMGPVLVNDVELRVASFPEVVNVEVDLVFDPAWSSERMSESARLELGMF